eukprot:TRINITY_DN118_c0_g2_i1.p2 TRINITY_DN118_c0_g2~~TRINITY_DN118_c0_g2_i1.p2  ORF type:complete len:100 (-),score=13.33 TRINITY_DN118_c0_g2_i1:94-393(-)
MIFDMKNADLLVSSKKQHVIMDSAPYSERVQIYYAIKDMPWIRYILDPEPTRISIDPRHRHQPGRNGRREEKRNRRHSQHWYRKFLFVKEQIKVKRHGT